MPERENLIVRALRESTRELNFMKPAEKDEPVAKFISNLNLIAGLPYMATFVIDLVKISVGDNSIPAIDFLSGAVPSLVIGRIYERVYSKYLQLTDDEKLKLEKKISASPIGQITNIVSRVIDFPITKRRVRYRTRVPQNVDLDLN